MCGRNNRYMTVPMIDTTLNKDSVDVGYTKEVLTAVSPVHRSIHWNTRFQF
jgi:hypothetical protein